MAILEPVPGEPAAVASLPDERVLVIADYHAGYEAELRYDRGIDVPSKAPDRRDRLLSLLEQTGVSHLVVLGDLMHSIGDPGGAERGELEVLFESFPTWLSVTVVKGNHDGEIESWLGHPRDESRGGPTPGTTDELMALDQLRIVPGQGVSLGDGTLGICHGHTWPAREVLESHVICHGHEHPFVRLEDEVGGARVEPAWLRGRLDPAAFRDRPEYADRSWVGENGDSNAETAIEASSATESDGMTPNSNEYRPPELVVFPAFNELVGGTWINVAGQSFLSPYLPDGLADSDVYLLDGTRLGSLASI